MSAGPCGPDSEMDGSFLSASEGAAGEHASQKTSQEPKRPDHGVVSFARNEAPDKTASGPVAPMNAATAPVPTSPFAAIL